MTTILTPRPRQEVESKLSGNEGWPTLPYMYMPVAQTRTSTALHRTSYTTPSVAGFTYQWHNHAHPLHDTTPAQPRNPLLYILVIHPLLYTGHTTLHIH